MRGQMSKQNISSITDALTNIIPSKIKTN
uniref:Uncharacterized protein n=1 Tax=Anguilla anguilla TaxID=7936 RepID=A0A0E9W2K6_ANGAN